jgi:O6-methylguanine-DNA--protein-cysteine methyltransferase
MNRFALVFPCHRVVSSTGIGGYGSAGLGLKRRLLALEGVEL